MPKWVLPSGKRVGCVLVLENFEMCALRCILFIYFLGKITFVRQKSISANFAKKVPTKMLEIAGDLCPVTTYFENPAPVISKDVRAHCYCASLLCTQIQRPRHASSVHAKR